MREFTKSMMSYTWAMSLFGVQQVVNVFRPSKAAESFENVTKATREEFGGGLRAAFRAGDNLQRGIVDLTFGVMTLGMFGGRGRSGAGAGADLGRRSADVARQSVNAMGQAIDAVGQTVQGAASYAADAARQSTGWSSARGGGDLGRQAADAVGQGIRAMGQAADAVGPAGVFGAPRSKSKSSHRVCMRKCDRHRARGRSSAARDPARWANRG